MKIFTPPTRLKAGEILAIVGIPIVLLLIPNSEFEKVPGGWGLGLFVALPASFVAGLLSCWIYYRNHKLTSVDPFYIRAWLWSIGAAIAWPLCLLFRPVTADFAFVTFMFCFGSVIAFHVYHRIRRHRDAL